MPSVKQGAFFLKSIVKKITIKFIAKKKK